MALVMAAQHWRPHLVGRKFVVRTDQHSLHYLLKQSVLTPTQHFWMAKLLGYDFDIEYKAGVSNRVANALSWSFEETELAAISVPIWLG